MARVRIKGLAYRSRAGEECPPYTVVELPTDEAHEVVTQGVADYEGLPEVETALAVAPVEARVEPIPLTEWVEE